MIDNAALRERLAVLREMGVARYNHDGEGKENIEFFPPVVAMPARSAKDLDDEATNRLAKAEQWERETSLGASGGIREKKATSATPGGGSVNPALNDAIRRERAQQTKKTRAA